MQRARRHSSLDEYFAVEADSRIKHEFHAGEIFAMAGASVAHSHITANLLALLRASLRGSGCSAFGSGLRVGTPGGLFTYPDVTVICGTVDLVPDRPDTAINPILLVEVLSETTRDYDSGEKLDLYRAIPSLREYLLVEQDRVAVRQLVFEPGGSSTEMKFTDLTRILRSPALGVDLPLAEIYREVFPAVR